MRRSSRTTNATTAQLRFSSDAAGATFECRIDDTAFAPCTSPATYAMLADGSHAFDVRATDPAGNTDESPERSSWTIDRAPPNTDILSGPSSPTTETEALFRFSATEPSSTFACRLDGAAPVPCDSPHTYSDLTDGPHTFRVAATDAAGNADPSDATQTWTIETAPPETTITAGPPAATGSSTAAFAFAANEPATFACRRGEQPFEACTSPRTYLGLGEGRHTFEVRATDVVQKTDPSPASQSWTVDLSPPAAVSLNEPADRSANLRTSPRFAWSPTSDDITGVRDYALLVDGVMSQTLLAAQCGPGACSAPAPAPLSDGSHSWQIRAVDKVGNASASATRTFTVDDAAPAAFTLQAPADGLITSSRRPSLAWQAAADAGIGLAGYDVLVDGLLAAAGLGATSFTPAGDLSDGVHRWRVVARDHYGHERESVEWRFTVDSTPPNASFTAAPNPVLAGRSVTFDGGGSQDGGSGISRYEWDLDGDGAFELDGGGTATTTRGYPEPGVFGIQLRVTDRAGLSSVGRSDLRVTTDQRHRGQLGVSIDDGADFTRDPDVTVIVTWPSFATQMLISDDGGFKQAQTFPLQASTPWRLDSSGAERLPKTIYVRFVRGLTVSETYTDDIILDESSPVVTSAQVVVPRKGGAAPLLKIKSRDRGLAGVDSVQVTNNRRDPKAKFRRSRATIKLTRRAGERRLDARKKVYVRVRDRAGNLSRWRVASRARSRSRG